MHRTDHKSLILTFFLLHCCHLIFKGVNLFYKLHDKTGQTKWVRLYAWDENMFIIIIYYICSPYRIFKINMLLFILKYLNYSTSMNK